ncbi:sugar kinase [Microbacterium sp. Au-Mic1]|uniref:sugar kinase n=1 Tax=Microbacterium sp. Au-Mic1 TaxID=2906457 RepID=UPI0027E07990|nr:sugar kinase [Microbacterium sp. Au-Mic1]
MGILLTAGEALLTVGAQRIGPLMAGGSAILGVAGSEATVAIGVARLGHQARWLTRLGDDEAGDAILRHLQGEGVHLLTARDPSRPTGLLLKNRRIAGSSAVHYYRAGSAATALTMDDVERAALADVDILHISGITAALSPTAREFALEVTAEARRAGVRVSFDLNHRRRLWSDDEAAPVLRELAARADIVFASDDEARLVVEDASASEPELAQRLRALGPGIAVITAGKQGAWYHDGTAGRQAALTVDEVDPFGAGDAFVAGFLSGVLEGLATAQCAARAAQVAAIGVATEGDAEGLPSRRELATLLSGVSISR